MPSARGYLLVGLALLVILVAVTARTRFSDREQITAPSDSDLIKLIEDCATGEGNLATLEKLRATSRGELSRALKRIRNARRADDALRVKVAFVSCLLGVDYNSNVEIVSRSLTKKPKYQDFYADDAASLVSGLLAAKKDNSLFKTLFASTDWADGALSDELAATFTKQAREDTTTFLTSIKTQRMTRRQRVYRLFDAASLSTKDREALRQHLSSVRKNSPLWPIAREMLKAIS